MNNFNGAVSVIFSGLREQRKFDSPSLKCQTNHHIYVNSNKGLPHQADVAMDKNNARINPGQTRAHEMSVGHYAGPGKSKNKGKGKNRPSAGFSKNPNKGFSSKGGK
jgi:hypothetical protein